MAYRESRVMEEGSLTDAHMILLAHVEHAGATHPDEIAAMLNIPVEVVTGLLVDLEQAGMIAPTSVH